MGLSSKIANGGTELGLFIDDTAASLLAIRNVGVGKFLKNNEQSCATFVEVLETLSSALVKNGFSREAHAIDNALEHTLEQKFYGGLGIFSATPFTSEVREVIGFQINASLESLNSEDNARKLLPPLKSRPVNRKPMTLSQKTLAHHSVGPVSPEGLSVGDLVRTSIDWVISSELAWEMLRALMEKNNAETIFRNDRLWLAGDHRVDLETMIRRRANN